MGETHLFLKILWMQDGLEQSISFWVDTIRKRVSHGKDLTMNSIIEFWSVSSDKMLEKGRVVQDVDVVEGPRYSKAPL